MCQTSSVYLGKKKIRLQSILDKYWEAYISHPDRRHYFTDHELKSVLHIRACRTVRLGHFLLACDSCGEIKRLHRSCKNRFCPQCGVVETASWANNLLFKLVNMYHHHVVLTLPAGLRGLAKRNKDVLYNLLFRVSSRVIKNWFVAKHGLSCGIVSVLHSSGSDLKYHPHVHLLVSAGGFDDSGDLQKLGGSYLMRHTHLSKMFRWTFQNELLKSFESGSLDLEVTDSNRIELKSLFARLNDQKWVVSIQEGLKDASSIVKYVGRYTKRACISEYKLLSYADDHIEFLYNDYKNSKRGEKPKVGKIRLHYVEFLDRLLSHVPHKGFRMVRYYGIYSSALINKIPKKYLRSKEEVLLTEAELESAISGLSGDFVEFRSAMVRLTGKDPLLCPYCNQSYKLFGYRKYNRDLDLVETIYYDDS